MDNQTGLNQIEAIARSLQPDRVERTVDRLLSAGIRSRDYSTGDLIKNGNSEPATGGFDAVDRWARTNRRRYHKKIAGARRLLEEAAAIESELCSDLNLEEAQAILDAERSATCANCHRDWEPEANDPLVGGRCHACYEYRRRHGDDAPRDVWEQRL